MPPIWKFRLCAAILCLLCLTSPALAQEGEAQALPQQPVSEPEPEPEPVSEPVPEPDSDPEPVPRSYPHIEHQGQLQLQLNDGDLGSARANNFTPANNGLAPFPASDRIFERRFRPAWNVWFSPKFSLQTEFEIDSLENEFDADLGNFRVVPLDLFLQYDFTQDTSAQFGRFKVPFGWEGLRSSRTVNTAERSDATVYMYPERDVGFSISHTQPGVGEFSLGTFLGQPRSTGDANGSVDVVGRAVFPLSESLKIGASGHLGSFRPTRLQVDIPVRRFGVELQYHDGPFKFESEAILSDGYNTASQADTPAFGYYFTTIYNIADSLDFVLSYDWFDPDMNSVDATRALNTTNSRDRKTIGLNYYISREPNHRIMLNYEMKQSLEGLPLDNSGFRLRYQISW